MRYGRNESYSQQHLSTKTGRCLEIYHLINVLRCGNRSTLKIKVLHNAIEETFWLNGSIKNHSVSQKVLCGKRRFFSL